MKTKTKPKISKDTLPEDFTLLLALTDSLPVFFFGASMLLIGRNFSSLLFISGALLCLIGGAGKVLWKIIVVLQKKNVWPLFIQMRILMPAGFLLMLTSLFANADKVSFRSICQAVTSFPSVISASSMIRPMTAGVWEESPTCLTTPAFFSERI